MSGERRHGRPPTELAFLLEELAKTNRRLDTLERPTGTQIAQSVQKITATDIGRARADGFALASFSAVQFNIAVPADMDYVKIAAWGHAEALDMTSGGAAVMRGDLEINIPGFIWSEGPFSASKDAGASVVNNVVNMATNYEHAITPGSSILVSLNLTATNVFAFTAQASNFATCTALALFSKSSG